MQFVSVFSLMRRVHISLCSGSNYCPAPSTSDIAEFREQCKEVVLLYESIEAKDSAESEKMNGCIVCIQNYSLRTVAHYVLSVHTASAVNLTSWRTDFKVDLTNISWRPRAPIPMKIYLWSLVPIVNDPNKFNWTTACRLLHRLKKSKWKLSCEIRLFSNCSSHIHHFTTS